MYGVKDITEMRKSGHLEEAYEMAQALREADPGEWADMALFWVLRDMVGQLLDTPTDEGRVRAQDLLTQMEGLQRTMKDDKNLGKPAIMKLRRMLSPHASDIAACSELAKSDPITAFDRASNIVGRQGESLDPSLHEELGWIYYRYLRAKGDQLAPREGPAVLWKYPSPKSSSARSSLIGPTNLSSRWSSRAWSKRPILIVGSLTESAASRHT